MCIVSAKKIKHKLSSLESPAFHKLTSRPRTYSRIQLNKGILTPDVILGKVKSKDISMKDAEVFQTIKVVYQPQKQLFEVSGANLTPVYQEIDLYSLFTAWDLKRYGFEKQDYVRLNTNPFYHGQRIAFTNKVCPFLTENRFLKQTHHKVIRLGMMQFREVNEIRYSQSRNQVKIMVHVLVYDLTPFRVLKSNLEE